MDDIDTQDVADHFLEQRLRKICVVIIDVYKESEMCTLYILKDIWFQLTII